MPEMEHFTQNVLAAIANGELFYVMFAGFAVGVLCLFVRMGYIDRLRGR